MSTTQPRLDARAAAPDAYAALLRLEHHVRKLGLERPLVDLICMRISQMNGCGYCLDMHAKDLRASGEPEQRLYALSGWRETPFYTDRERAALAWAEALTELHPGHVSDAVYAEARQAFSERELVELTLAVGTINTWNRFGIAFRSVAGSYNPAAEKP